MTTGPPRLARPTASLLPGMAAARNYAQTRAGAVSFALVDPAGRVHGFRQSDRYVSASVVKAMLLVSYLRANAGRALSGAEQARLGAMIRRSDNDAATATYRQVGDKGLYGVARLAGMRRYSVRGHWAKSQITAADQARFFSRVSSLVPKQHRSFARTQLSSITSSQRWGIPQALGSNDHVWFKGGWRGTGRGQLVHQAAHIERGGAHWGIAILTDGSPTHAYGVETVRGVAQRLLGTA